MIADGMCSTTNTATTPGPSDAISPRNPPGQISDPAQKAKAAPAMAQNNSSMAITR